MTAQPSSDDWLIIDSGPGAWDFNMALDEVLLDAAPALGRPVLRFYGWREAAASFGYFQRIAEIEQLTALRPLVRRPTGGGLVPHDRDWTYSVVIPPGHSWYALRAMESYARVHQLLQEAFARVGIPTELAPSSRKVLPGQCFSGHEQSDVLWMGRKIAGAAQRRTRAGLLIQGSVQPPPPELSRAQWQQAMGAILRADNTAARGFSGTLPEELAMQATELASAKYSRNSHNRKR